MEIFSWLALPSDKTETAFAEINGRPSVGGLSITREDERMLAGRKRNALTEVKRVEFGIPAVVHVTEAVAGSPHLTQTNVAEVLAELQDAFYAIRDELGVDVPTQRSPMPYAAVWTRGEMPPR